MAGKSTLNRLELTPENANEKSRYKKIVADGEQIGGVDIEHDLLGGGGLGFNVGIHDQIFDCNRFPAAVKPAVGLV